MVIPGISHDDPYADLSAYVSLPRISGLAVSPDGCRLILTVATADRGGNRYTTALWELDAAGVGAARRLTWSTGGESAAAFLPSGDLLFTSARPGTNPGTSRLPASLWLLPAGGGEARVVAAPPGGVRGVAVAREAGTIVLGSAMLPSSADAAADRELRASREASRVSAILHEEYPVRYWDHDLGPDRARLLVIEGGADEGGADEGGAHPAVAAGPRLRDLTGHVGRALTDEATWDITPDGRTVVCTWAVAEPAGSQRHTVVAIDVGTGDRRTLAGDAENEYDSPRLSPDGDWVAMRIRRRTSLQEPGDWLLGLVPVAGGEVRELTARWDRWPHSACWAPDGSALVVAADDGGRTPLWRIDAATGRPDRLTTDGAYASPQVSADGCWVYALRSSVDSPPVPVRVAMDGTGAAKSLLGPGYSAVPGRLEEITATAADGTPLRAWIALPRAGSVRKPYPLLLWMHGGPPGSWSAWHWRWNPWPAVARGYAVLLPDPAMSTGYGTGFIRRGWGAWGDRPYTDLMTITDAALARDDIDPARTAALGGSFGGYLANWVAGHTSRFRAIVSHASIWVVDQFGSDSDMAYYWHREIQPQMMADHSPHYFADSITTPVLVIHGGRDFRCPIGESERLWWDLVSRSAGADGSTPHKFLYFPDENHWILTPNHAELWYATILAFLAHHVLGEDWERPGILG